MAMIITFPGGKRVDAQYKGFTIQTDQPESAGGGGSAPAPFDLFLASIGTCAGIYVLAFCQERGIPADGTQLTMETERDPDSNESLVVQALAMPYDKRGIELLSKAIERAPFDPLLYYYRGRDNYNLLVRNTSNRLYDTAIDDLDKKDPGRSGWAREELYTVLNHRYNAQLPTILTFNYAPVEADPNAPGRLRLERYLGRALVDRVIGAAFDVVAFDGPSYRSGVPWHA